jgi:VIT1/CCC1 family predicted Fe2+/Mn2+ transporter
MWGLLSVVLGVAYGWLTPGRADKSRLFVNGLWIGLIVAILAAVLGGLLRLDPLFFGVGAFGLFMSVVLMTLLFIVGVWIGDLIEGGRSRTRTV